MRAISRRLTNGATGLLLFSVLVVTAALWGCGARQSAVSETPVTPTTSRVLPLSRVIVLETSGPPPPDTSVTFIAGTPRTIVLYHGGENVTFARVIFESGAFADSGRTVQVDVRPRPGLYGVDLTTSLPFQEKRAAVVFEYARYFSAPARGRQLFGSDVAFERALAVGRVLPDGQIELLPSVRPAADNLRATLPAPGSYLVAAPR